MIFGNSFRIIYTNFFECEQLFQNDVFCSDQLDYILIKNT